MYDEIKRIVKTKKLMYTFEVRSLIKYLKTIHLGNCCVYSKIFIKMLQNNQKVFYLFVENRKKYKFFKFNKKYIIYFCFNNKDSLSPYTLDFILQSFYGPRGGELINFKNI